jgi:hypothetical protein
VLMAATASEPSEKVSLDNTPRQASLTLIRGRDVDLATRLRTRSGRGMRAAESADAAVADVGGQR